MKDINGVQIQVGYIILRPVFSTLHTNLVLSITANGLNLSRKLKHFPSWRPEGDYWRDVDSRDVTEHNSKFYVNNSDINHFVIIGKVDTIPNLPSRTQFIKKAKKDKNENI